jgi:hypothetical protein
LLSQRIKCARMKTWCLEMIKECLVYSSMRLGVPFIAAIQEGYPCLLSGGAPDSPVHHWTLSGADCFPILAQPTVEDLEPLAHRTVWCPHQTVGSATRHARIARPTVGAVDHWLTGQSGAPPDSPVNYSRTPPSSSRERPVDQRQPGAPDTVRCTQTEQSLGCFSQDIFLLSFL